MIALDVDERHLLRLGHGQGQLATEKDFSKTGKINYMLARRLLLLNKVDQLGKLLGIDEGAVGYTRETAARYYLKKSLRNFPFQNHFSYLPQDSYRSLQELHLKKISSRQNLSSQKFNEFYMKFPNTVCKEDQDRTLLNYTILEI